MTPALLCVGLVLVPIADAAQQQLAADVRTVLDRLGISPKVGADLCDMALGRFYKQINGHLPMTCFWRLWVREPDFRWELMELYARRADALLVRGGDLKRLVVGVETLTQGLPKRMAKAALPPQREEQAS